MNYPIRLNNKLAALQGMVESGDVKPTDQSYAVFKELSARLDKELARLEALVKTDVAAFNKLLSGAEPRADHRSIGGSAGGCRSTVTSTTPTGSSTATNRSSGFSTPSLNRSAGRYGRSWSDERDVG